MYVMAAQIVRIPSCYVIILKDKCYVLFMINVMCSNICKQSFYLHNWLKNI